MTLHTLSRGERRTAAQPHVGARVHVDIEHPRDGARARWTGQLLALAEPLSAGTTDQLVLQLDDTRVVCIALTTVARIRVARPTAAKRRRAA